MHFDLSKRPVRHSYSSVKLYKECPQRYARRYIAKMEDPPSAAMQRGSRLHKLAEDYLNNPDMSCPYDIRKLGLRIFQLRNAGAKAEVVMRVDADWRPVHEDSEAKLKAIIDVHRLDNDVLKIHDYKSGREYPDHVHQLEFYSAIGLIHYPDAKRAESSALYFDSGSEGAERGIIREMLPSIIRRWDADMGAIDGDGEFRPTGGGHCKRCPYRSSNGIGTCEGWRGHIPEGT